MEVHRRIGALADLQALSARLVIPGDGRLRLESVWRFEPPYLRDSASR
jgi:hypothetical protein